MDRYPPPHHLASEDPERHDRAKLARRPAARVLERGVSKIPQQQQAFRKGSCGVAEPASQPSERAGRASADLCDCRYDFFYLPIDFKNRCNLGYAFVNLTSPHAAAELYKQWHERHWEEFNSRKVRPGGSGLGGFCPETTRTAFKCRVRPECVFCPSGAYGADLASCELRRAWLVTRARAGELNSFSDQRISKIRREQSVRFLFCAANFWYFAGVVVICFPSR